MVCNSIQFSLMGTYIVSSVIMLWAAWRCIRLREAKFEEAMRLEFRNTYRQNLLKLTYEEMLLLAKERGIDKTFPSWDDIEENLRQALHDPPPQEVKK